MMTKTITFLLACIFTVAISHAQKTERIDFVKEKSNFLVWEQKVKAKSSKTFVFYAKKGQKLTLSFIDDTKQGSMDLGKVSIEPNADEPHEQIIEVTKDYTFTVTNNSGKETSFRISIGLEDPKGAAPAPKATSAVSKNKKEKVQFGRGQSDASLTRSIEAGGSIEFTINAKKGQRIDFTVGYDFKDSDVEVYLQEPGVTDEIALSTGPKSPNEYKVLTSGNHRLYVMNTTKKKITVTLYLAIE